MTRAQRFWLSLLLAYVPAGAQAFRADYREELTYPSLTSRHVLKLDLSDWNGIWRDIPPLDWNPLDVNRTAPFHDPARYYVRKSNTERVPVERIEFPKCDGTPRCPEGPDYTTPLLVLNPTQLRSQDKVVVYLMPPGQSGGPDDARNPKSNEVTIPKVRNFLLGLEPSFVPDQELDNGKKRQVGHLGTDIQIQRINLWGGFARSFIRSQSNFSSDYKDKSSKWEARWMVLERALPGAWYLPVQFETKGLGDQTARNLSWVNSAGISGLIPWRWTRKAFYGEYFQIPVSPVWRFSAQHEYRAVQDERARVKFPDQNAFRVYGEVTWAPIRLLPSGGNDTLSLELAGRGWYFPSDRNNLGNKIERLEGQFDVSLLVPLTKFDFTGAALVSNPKSQAKQRIRIKYSAGANEAKAFIHYSQLSLGVELVK